MGKIFRSSKKMIFISSIPFVLLFGLITALIVIICLNYFLPALMSTQQGRGTVAAYSFVCCFSECFAMTALLKICLGNIRIEVVEQSIRFFRRGKMYISVDMTENSVTPYTYEQRFNGIPCIIDRYLIVTNNRTQAKQKIKCNNFDKTTFESLYGSIIKPFQSELQNADYSADSVLFEFAATKDELAALHNKETRQILIFIVTASAILALDFFGLPLLGFIRPTLLRRIILIIPYLFIAGIFVSYWMIKHTPERIKITRYDISFDNDSIPFPEISKIKVSPVIYRHTGSPDTRLTSYYRRATIYSDKKQYMYFLGRQDIPADFTKQFGRFKQHRPNGVFHDYGKLCSAIQKICLSHNIIFELELH